MSIPGGFLDVGGQHLEAVWHGPGPNEAPTLVFLHEGLGCVGMWRDFPPKLAAATGLGALVYSRRGYGRSEPGPLPRPLDYMQRHARDILPALLDTAGIKRVLLVGHSDGASISLVYAGMYADDRRLAGLVLEAPHVFCEELSVRSIAQARDAFETGDLRAGLAKYHGHNVDGAFWGWNRAWLDPAFMNWNIEQYLPTIRVPTLVVQGLDDQYGTPAQVKAIVHGSGGPVEVAMLKDCAHTPHREQEVKTLAAMTDFVTRIVG